MNVLCAIKVILCIEKIRVFLYLCAIKMKLYDVHLCPITVILFVRLQARLLQIIFVYCVALF